MLLDWKLGVNGYPQAVRKLDLAIPDNLPILYVPVPSHFQQIKQADMQAAIDWRISTREIFVRLFAEGWAAAHLLRGEREPVHYYVLVKCNQLALA